MANARDSARTYGKSDPIDALAVARAALREPDLPVRANWLGLQPLAPRGPLMNFQPVKEAKAGKGRLHLDVLVGDLDAGVERVRQLGGTDTGAREELPRGRIAVTVDPAGNEFCLIAAPSSSGARSAADEPSVGFGLEFAGPQARCSRGARQYR